MARAVVVNGAAVAVIQKEGMTLLRARPPTPPDDRGVLSIAGAAPGETPAVIDSMHFFDRGYHVGPAWGLVASRPGEARGRAVHAPTIVVGRLRDDKTTFVVHRAADDARLDELRCTTGASAIVLETAAVAPTLVVSAWGEYAVVHLCVPPSLAAVRIAVGEGGIVNVGMWDNTPRVQPLQVYIDARTGGTAIIDVPETSLAPIQGACVMGGRMYAPTLCVPSEFVVRTGGSVEPLRSRGPWSGV